MGLLRQCNVPCSRADVHAHGNSGRPAAARPVASSSCPIQLEGALFRPPAELPLCPFMRAACVRRCGLGEGQPGRWPAVMVRQLHEASLACTASQAAGGRRSCVVRLVTCKHCCATEDHVTASCTWPACAREQGADSGCGQHQRQPAPTESGPSSSNPVCAAAARLTLRCWVSLRTQLCPAPRQLPPNEELLLLAAAAGADWSSQRAPVARFVCSASCNCLNNPCQAKRRLIEHCLITHSYDFPVYSTAWKPVFSACSLVRNPTIPDLTTGTPQRIASGQSLPAAALGPAPCARHPPATAPQRNILAATPQTA